MGLFDSNEQDTPVKTPQNSTQRTSQQPAINGPQYESAVVDSRYDSKQSLLINLEGSTWYADYYSQVLGNDDEPSPLQLSKDSVYQQYQKINHLELRVTEPLNQSQAEDSNDFEVTGTARMYPKLIPNKGDMFIADIGDGRAGVFAVTSCIRLTIYRDSAYEIQYRLVSEANETYVSNLETKTIESNVFVKDLLTTGQTPLISSDDYNRYQYFAQYYEDLQDYHYRQFFDRSIDSLQVPSQRYPTYDPFVVKALKTVGSLTDHVGFTAIKLYRTQLASRVKPFTFWDSFIELASEKIQYTDQKLAVVDSAYFGLDPRLDSLLFSGIDRVVYPIDSNFEGWPKLQTPNLFRRFYNTRYYFKLNNEALERRNPIEPIVRSEDGDQVSRPDIHPVTVDDYYVLSQAFYDNTPETQSRLERLVRCAMNYQSLDSDTLLHLCDQSRHWEPLEQFYYIPVLLILLKIARQ